jgi:hypothetical protein
MRGLGVADVEPALAGQQKLASHRGHGVKNMDRVPCGLQNLGRHQTGRAAADHGNRNIQGADFAHGDGVSGSR